MRGPVTRGYHTVCVVLADLGRDDVLGVLVNWRGGGWPMSEVVAGYLPRLLLNQPHRTSISTIVRTIWNNERIRTMTVRELTATLQVWVADPSAEQALQIVSHLEVLLNLGAGADLRAAVVAKLVPIAAASSTIREAFARYAVVSSVAAAITGACDGGNADVCSGGVGSAPGC